MSKFTFDVVTDAELDEKIELVIDSRDLVLYDSDLAFVDLRLPSGSSSETLSVAQLEELQSQVARALQVIRNGGL